MKDRLLQKFNIETSTGHNMAGIFEKEINKGGPKVVVMGGGLGLSKSVQAGLFFAGYLVAVVSVADDGGSSGRLRKDFNMVPVGDIRKSLSAAMDQDSIWPLLLEYRFETGELKGHTAGNIMLAALFHLEGDVLKAVKRIGQLFNINADILPVSLDPILLKGIADGGQITGQTELAKTKGIKKILFEPDDPDILPEIKEAIIEADLIVLGPGSLYTSVLACCGIPKIKDLLNEKAKKLVYVCNAAVQVGETSGYSVRDHFEALNCHGIHPNICLWDEKGKVELGQNFREAFCCDIVKPDTNQHDPVKLAAVLAEIERSY
jgi:uncharacterized cofD-like protein